MEILLKWFTLALATTLSLQRTIRQESELKVDSSNSPNSYGELSGLHQNNEFDNCSCDTRYISHYEAKGCRPAQRNACGCPTKFECPNVNEIEENSKVCQYKGKTFLPGEEIDTKNPCQNCHCSVGVTIDIVCTSVECPDTTDPEKENCHHIYEEDKCCPIKTVCFGDDDTINTDKQNVTCVYNDRIYPLGARMRSKEDPCEVCLCTEEWVNTNGTDTSCYQTNCFLEKFKSKLLMGCVPVYQEDTCCPIDFYCAPGDEFLHDNKTLDSEMGEDLQCVFFGKRYAIEEKVTISGESDCMSCACQVPPDVTCIQQTCPPNPMKENCYPYYTAGGGCCPQYECLLNDGEDGTVDDDTDDNSEPFSKREMEDGGFVPDPENMPASCTEFDCQKELACMLFQVNCGTEICQPVPTCMPTNMSCPTPLCDIGYVVVDQDPNHCPTCVLAEDIEKHSAPLRCPMPVCSGSYCHMVTGDDGCPKCTCYDTLAGPSGRGCPEPKCQPGCNVLRGIGTECPKCVCEDETPGCPTPVCEHEGCRIVTPAGGCPTCICGPRDSERELEGVASENKPHVAAPNQEQQQQQHQQQQQQTNQEAMEPRDNYPHESSSEEYDDAIVLMQSGSSLGETAPLTEWNAEENTSKTKRLAKSENPASNVIETVELSIPNVSSQPIRRKKDV